MNNLKIAICDDDPIELQKITGIVQDFAGLGQAEVAMQAFASSRDLLLQIEKSGCFDILILDIIMDGLSGIELAARIREHNDWCKIIFLTSSPEFAVDSYKVKAFYYLLKGNVKEALIKLLQAAVDEEEASRITAIMVKEKGKWTRVPIHAIHYIESINHTINFHLRNETLSSFNTLNAFQDVLLADRRFVKCHKSYIVNMNYVASITTKDFVLAGGAGVPISRNVYQQVKDAYFDYFFNK